MRDMAFSHSLAYTSRDFYYNFITHVSFDREVSVFEVIRLPSPDLDMDSRSRPDSRCRRYAVCDWPCLILVMHSNSNGNMREKSHTLHYIT